MGSAGQLFTRNADFESTFPELGHEPLTKNRHGGRISLLEPDPQVISRRLFTRDQTQTPELQSGQGHARLDRTPTAITSKAPFFNVLAAFWIQFMTHDWFAHPEDARNNQAKAHDQPRLRHRARRRCDVVPLTPERAAALGCRPEDDMEAGLSPTTRRRRTPDRGASASPAPTRPAGTSSPRGGTPRRSTASTNGRCGA